MEVLSFYCNHHNPKATHEMLSFRLNKYDYKVTETKNV